MKTTYRPWVVTILLLGFSLGFDQVHAVHSFRGVKRASAPQFLTWCGKHYQNGSPADTDQLVFAGRTGLPSESSTPLLDFRCTAAEQPYLNTDGAVFILIDANITYDVGHELPSSFDPSSASSNLLDISISTSSSSLARVQIPLGTLGAEVSIPIDALPPSSTSYNITCTGTLSSQSTFTAQTTLRRLPPNPYAGSTTKLDRRTGALLRQSESSGDWRNVLTFGFYTSFETLRQNLSVIDQMAADGFTTIHLIPTYDGPQSLVPVLDRADARNITYMADFRDIYTNTSAMQPYIELFRERKGLLTWYTADEPDGPGDDPAAAQAAYDLLYEMDGYHPVALVLNCWDFQWEEYTKGADVVLSDPYPIANNVTFSKQYQTVCNETYGCCGCDDCEGSLADITNKMDVFANRRRVAGRGREMSLWSVPQAFDGLSEFWTRVPTGAEFSLQTILSVNHGATGIMPWDDPYDTPDIAVAARAIAPVFSGTLAGWLLDAGATRVLLNSHANNSAVDVALWARQAQGGAWEALVLVGNMGDAATARVDLAGAGFEASEASLRDVFGGNAAVGVDGDGALVSRLEKTGIVGAVVQLNAVPDSVSSARTNGTGATQGKKKAGASCRHAVSFALWQIVVGVLAAIVVGSM